MSARLTETFLNRIQGQGETHLGEQFSPSAGFLFQINVFNADGQNFYVFLKNCGKESVKILQFKVVPQYTKKSPETISAEKTNFSLPPGVSVAVPAIAFQISVRALYALTCYLEIEATLPGSSGGNFTKLCFFHACFLFLVESLHNPLIVILDYVKNISSYPTWTFYAY